MNRKQSSIEAVMTMRSCPDVRGMAGPVAYEHLRAVSRPGARIFHAPVQAGTRNGVSLRANDYYAREFWETLSYAVIWLCGLTGIIICFR